MPFIPTINQITISGNVSDRPQISRTQNGMAICLFPIVINQIKDNTRIIRIITIGKIAEYLHRKLSKGNSVLVKGSLRFGNNNSLEIFAQTVKN